MHPSQKLRREFCAESLERRLLFAAATFATTDHLTYSFGPGLDSANALAVQADGKIVVAGTATVTVNGSTATELAVIRYNSDGSLDDGGASDATPDDQFGTNGTFTLSTSAGLSASDIAIQSDGKIVVGGTELFHGTVRRVWTFVRLNADGTLDTSFDGGQVVEKPGSHSMLLSGIALQSDGKLVAVGSEAGDVWVSRLNVDGTTDTNFGAEGFVQTDFNGYDAASGVAIDNLGRIVVAGTSGNNYQTDHLFNSYQFARYLPNGVLDPNFGTAGKVIVLDNDPHVSGNLVIGSDGTIYAGEAFLDSVHNQWEASTAAFDTTGHSVAVTGLPAVNNAQLNSIALLPSGTLAGGGVHLSTSNSITNGFIYKSGADLTYNLSNNSSISAVAIAADGSIYAAGYLDSSSTDRSFLLIKATGENAKAFGSIRGNVFLDTDRDSVRDPNESGISNIRVYADLNNDGEFATGEPSALTDLSGNYTIPGLSPATVNVREIVPDTQETSINHPAVTVVGGRATTSNFINSPQPTVSTQTQITGSVFNDWNSNGKRDVANPTEPDLSKQTVFLDANANGKLDTGETQTLTDAGGDFALTLPAGGHYRVAVVQPAHWIASTPHYFDFTVHTHAQAAVHFGLALLDPDDTIRESGPIKAGQTVAGTISDPTDVDLLKFTVGAGQYLWFDEDAASGSSLNGLLELFDSKGHLLTSNDNRAAPGETPGVDAYIKYKFATAGTYYIGVSDHLNSSYIATSGAGDVGGGTTGKYTLSISAH